MNLLNIECFGDNMKKAREEIKMSQKDLAEKVGLTPTTISAYEKGQKFPSLDNAITIANALNLSLDNMCGVESNKTSFVTYGDVMEVIMEVVDITNGSLLYDRSDGYYGMRTIGYPNDDIISEFLEEWNKVRILYIDKTIDPVLYTAWKEKKIRDSQIPLKQKEVKTTVIKMTSPKFEEISDDDDLPF